jgi:hypothetical protein
VVDQIEVTLAATIPLRDGDGTYLYLGRDSAGGLCGWFAADADVTLDVTSTRSARTVLTARAGDAGTRARVDMDEFALAARRWVALRLLEYAGSMLGGTLVIVGGDRRFASEVRDAAAGLGMKSRWIARSSDLHDTQAFTSAVTLERSPTLSRVLASVMTGGQVAVAAPIGSTDVDLYADVHRRNVSLVGVPPLATMSCYPRGLRLGRCLT